MIRKFLAALAAMLALVSCGFGQPAGAIRVNYQVIGMPAYTAELRADRGQPVEAITQLVRRAVIEQLARQRGIAISAKDFDADTRQLEQAAGGKSALSRLLARQGLSNGQFRELLRTRLLERALLRSDPKGYSTALGKALQQASVQVFVGPCATDHDYPKCVTTAR